MKQEHVIRKVREIRDEALSLKNVTELLCTPDDQQTFTQSESWRIAENAGTALAYLDNLNMYYGGGKDLGDVKGSLTPEAFAKEEFGPETVNKAFHAYDDPEYMKFARNEREGREEAYTTPSERDLCIAEMGLRGQCYSDILHDPAYVNSNEVFRLHLLEEGYKDGYDIERDAVEKELSVLAHKKDVQDVLKRLTLSRKAQDGPRTKESLMDDYKKIYALLVTDPPGTSQTAWQLGQLNELCMLVGGKDRKEELDKILDETDTYASAVPRYQWIPDTKRAASLPRDVQQEAIDDEEKPDRHLPRMRIVKFHHPEPDSRLLKFREECMKDICDRLFPREQEQLMNLSEDFRLGKDLSMDAVCAWTLTHGGEKPYDFIPDRQQMEDVIVTADCFHLGIDSAMKSMQDLAPFAPHKDLRAAALRHIGSPVLWEDYREFQKAELRKIYDRATILNGLREGNTEPLRKRVELLLDDLSPRNIRRMSDKRIHETGREVQRAAEKTIETFKESANKFLPDKMKFPTNSKGR